eukprot:90643-Amphidinium_carterae.1
MAEVKEGWLSGPMSVEDLDQKFPEGWLPIRRFGLKQGSKLRPIDDGREALVNGAVQTSNTLDLHDVDTLAAVARLAM